MKTIIGLYDDHHTAEKVERELAEQGFSGDRIRTHHHHAAGTDTGLFSGNRIDNLTRHGVPRDEAEFFIEGVRRGGSLVMIQADDAQAATVADVMNRHEPVRREERMSAWRERGYTGFKADAPLLGKDEAQRERAEYIGTTARTETPTQQRSGKTTEERVPIVEEEMHVGKRKVERGSVGIHTWVEQTPVEETVHLHEERVDVERRKVDRPVTDADDAFRERTIEMEESAEEVVAEKQARVVEEVIVKKEGHDRTETVRDTVRRTHVDVDERADGARTTGAGYANYADTFQTHFRSNYANDGNRAYADYEPAYQHGYTFATNEAYAGRDYGTLEPEMRSSYERKHGEGTWDRIKDAVRHAFDSGREGTRREGTTRGRTTV